MPNLWKLHRRGPRTRPGKPIQPTAIQLAYFQSLREMVRYMRALTNERMVPILPALLAAAAPAIVDGARADGGGLGRVNRITGQMIRAWSRRWDEKRIAAIVGKIARMTSDHQRRELFRQIKSGLGIELATIADHGLMARIQHFVAENVALIRTVPQEYFGQVEKVVLAGVKSGRRASEIAADLDQRAEVATSRVKVIARDQVNKFQAALNHARQTSLGVKRFAWMTMGDDRVRPEHAERNGKVYGWDDPPGDADDPGDGARPGDGIQCRCYAAPQLDEILASLDGRRKN